MKKLLISAVIIVMLTVTTMSAYAKEAAEIDQCQNGPDALTGGAKTIPTNCTGSAWVNGNAGPQNSHYIEGYSIPYRIIMTGLTPGEVISIDLGYEIRNGGANAIDYLTNFSNLDTPQLPHLFLFGHPAEFVDPTSGVSGLTGPITTFPIPTPNSVGTLNDNQPVTSFNKLVNTKVMTLYGGTITNVYYLKNGSLSASASETDIRINFTANSSTEVLSWGGHIASSLDWGAGNSASAISGSPYHMFMNDWILNGVITSLGSQDRSLKAQAVAGPALLNIVKNTLAGGDNTFGFNVYGPDTFSTSITTSGNTGSTGFKTIIAGTYSVNESTIPTGWKIVPPASCNDGSSTFSGTTVSNINAAAGSSITCTFNDTILLGSISGLKFNDLNGNGVRDGGEPTLQGWTINLTNSTTGILIQTTTTDSNGNYSFSGLLPGSYNVSEVLQPGWIRTLPTPPQSNITVNVQSGSVSTGNNFGNFQLGSISGLKFNDLNGNGVRDGGEPTLQGWTINLTKPDGTTASNVTASDGTFSFTGLINGTYTLTEVLQPGWIQTAPNVSTTGSASITVNVQSGTVSTGNNFGNFQLGIISGMKFNDLTGNGNNAGGLQGWTINLTGHDTITNQDVSLSTQTDANGNFSFTNLTNGTYTLTEVLKPGWIETTPIYSATGSAGITVNVQSGTVSTGNNFGNFQLGSISGMKFNDFNDNGSLDAGEPGLAVWTINLTGHDTITNQDVSLSTQTDANGNFSFTNLTNGTYTLTEVLQPGWIQTAPASGSITVNVQSGTSSTGNNFGNFQLRHLSFIKSGFLDMSDGKMLNYTINATNDGFAPLDIVNITDPNDPNIGSTCSPSLIAYLAHGQSIICNTTYPVGTQVPNINAPTVIQFRVNGTTANINLSI